ncbi:unnamed protein product [Closterium sp. NIES-54]
MPGKLSASKPNSEKLSAEEPASGEPLAELPTGEQFDYDSSSDEVVEVVGAATGGEGEPSTGEQSEDDDVVEVAIEEAKARRSARPNIGKPPEKLSYHACLPPTAYSTLLDDTEDDIDLPELDPAMHADPKHRWNIANMTMKEALASWKGRAVKAAMDEEIRSLISNGTWELVEHAHGVNIMKNRWVLMTKYHVDDTLAREKSCLVVNGFTQVYSADNDETYAPVGSYMTLRIFLSIVAVLDLHLMQLDMKNTFLQLVATTTRPDIAFASSKLGSGLTVRCDNHWHEVDRCLYYLADTRGAALDFGGRPESLCLVGYADADDAGD